MQIKLVQELTAYSFSQFRNLFGLAEAETSALLDRLMLLNILRKGTAENGELSLEDLTDMDYAADANLDNPGKIYYVFRYVGIIVIGPFCFFCYPKYINDMEADQRNGYPKFRQIISVIRKYQASNQQYRFAEEEGIREFNLLSFTLDMLQDYQENGLYHNDKSIVENNGFGEILWEKTINEQNVYMSEGIPLYLDFYTANEVTDEEDIFRLMQQTIITECCHVVGDLLRIIGVDPLYFSTPPLDELGSEDYLVTRVQLEMSRQFVTRNQTLLRKMLSYLNDEPLGEASQTVSLVGTSSFNLVWEEVCAQVLGDCRRKTLRRLKLKPIGKLSSYDMLKDVVPKPRWLHYESKKTHEASGTLIPDLITVEEGELSIYDAKYYSIELNENGVSHQPGIADVTKQYLYEMAYRKLAEHNGITVRRNAFLFPLDDDSEQHVGEVTLELFEDINMPLNNVQVILEPCHKMFEEYLERS